MRNTIVALLIACCLALAFHTGGLAAPRAEQAPLDLEQPIASFKVEQEPHRLLLRDVLAERQLSSRFLVVPTTPTLQAEWARQLTRQATYRALLFEEAQQKGSALDTTTTLRLQGQLDTSLVRLLQAEVSKAAAEPDEQALKSAYEQQRERFQEPEQFTIQYVFSYVEDRTNPAAEQQARTRIEQAQKRLAAGETFEAVARDLSSSPSGNHGEPIRFKPGTLNPQLEKLVQTLRDGELSGIYEVDAGFVLVRRIAHSPARVKPFEDVRATLRASLIAKAGEAQWDAFYQARLKDFQPSMNRALLLDVPMDPKTQVFKFADVKLTYGDVALAVEPFRKLPEQQKNDGLTRYFNQVMMAYEARKRGLDRAESYLEERRRTLRDLYYERDAERALQAAADLPEPSEQEVTRFYEENKASFVSERETRLQVVRVPLPAEQAGQSALERKARAFNTAEQLRRRIVAGEDMPAVMREQNGEWNGEWAMEPYGPRGHEVDLAVEKLAVGEVSMPVEFKQGFYIIRVAEERPARPLALDEVRERIREGLRQQAALQRWEAHKDEALQRAGYQPPTDDAVHIILKALQG